MNKKVIKKNKIVHAELTDQPITGNELRNYYHNLSKFVADEFRIAVIERCGWTYAIWLTRIASKTKITKLESEAIRPIMQSFKAPNVA